MNAEATSPRTWLLGAVAGWAMLVWVLALFGLSGHIERLADDPSLAQKLPALPASVPERLGPFGQYSEFSRRPLFSEDRLPKSFTLQPEGEAQQETFNFVLTSVLLSPRVQLAIIQPDGGGDSIRLKVGEAPEAAPSYQLLSLTPRGAVFAGPDGEKTLELRVFDGAGGETPTAIRATPTAGVATPGQASQRPTRNMTVPLNPAVPAKPGSGAATNVPPTVTNPPPPTADSQVEEIRKRIEARRAQLREQQPSQPSPSQPPAPDKTQ